MWNMLVILIDIELLCVMMLGSGEDMGLKRGRGG